MARRPDRPDKRADSKPDRKSDRQPDRKPGKPRDGRRDAAGKPPRSLRPGHVHRDDAPRAADERATSSSTHPDDKLIRVAGLPSVAELFETGAERVERLYFEAEHKADVQEWCAYLARRRKVYRQLGDDEMRRVAGTTMHGGVVAHARPRPLRELPADAAETWAAAGQPLLILDGVGNPQNIGAIARTAAFFGVRRMLLSDHPGQAGLSDASYRVAKGGLDRLELYRASGLPEVLRRLAAHYHVVGTAIERGIDLKKLNKSGKPLALVMGNEEAGLAPATLAACTSVVALHGPGHVQSLNVSAAAAILIHALLAG